MSEIELLSYTIPALIVFLTSVFTIRFFIKDNQQQRKIELLLENQKIVTPIRLQAYERITLFLERITPDSLIMRVMNPKMNSKQLQAELLKAIRAEFEHNLSQQIYVSTKAWDVIKNSKEQVIKIINTCFINVKPNDPAIRLSAQIIEKMIEIQKSPTHTAIEFLKEEIKSIL